MQPLTIKEAGDEGMVLGGYGIVFGGTDLDGDTFTKDTDFDLTYVPQKVALWSHAKDSKIRGKIGQVQSVKVDEVGVWFETQIARSQKYFDAIKRLADMGMLGYSTGTAPQLMIKEANVIKTWPIVEVSITPCPAEPRTLGLQVIKEIATVDLAIVESLTGSEAEQADQPVDAGTASVVAPKVDEPVVEVPITEKGVNFNMATEQTFEQQVTEFMKSWQAKQAETDGAVKNMNEQFNRLLTEIEGSRKLMGAGYVTQDGGTADKNIKTFGDFLISVKRHDSKRLAEVYKATKDLSPEVGASGGYLVPPDFETTLLQLAAANNVVMSKVRTIPVKTDSGRWPALDQYVAPTAGAGDTAFAGGVKAATTAAGATLSKTEPTFDMLDWRLHKIGGYTVVDNELIDDSPTSVEALLTGLFAVAVGAKTERHILRGTGVGEPLGILNAASLVTATAANAGTFAWTDVATMWSRFHSAGGTPVWLIHPSIWPDILNMSIGGSNLAVWTANMQGGPGQTLNGYQILTGEHLPQANSAGSTMLLDIGAYLLFQRSGLS